MWFYVYETATGRLLSESDVSVTLKPGHARLERPTRADLGVEMWDPASRTFIARPAKILVDRLDDLQTWPEFTRVWSVLNAARRTDLRNAVIRILGQRRFRNQTEVPELE